MANSAVDVRNRRFAEAKELMKTIYETEKNFVQSMVDIVANKDFPQKWGFEILKEMGEKIESICKIIGRGKMKAVFFGMTSSGKSALINTLLRDNVLPSLCGETTSAFITVEGTDEPNAYAEDVKGSRIKIEDIGKRSSVLESGKMSCDKITVYWPKRKCGLLKNELVVVDCPGTCTSSDTDDQVTKYCKDADIHIFVVNSISSLNEAACKFFEEVARRFSKPNILAVFTMWDLAQQMMTSKIDQEKVRGQHQRRATELLKDILGVVETDEEAAERIFLTAPIEILKKDKGSLLKDWQEREKEFYRFEGTFKELVSTSAIETKFKGHYEKGKRIVDKATEHLEEMATVLQSSMKAKEDQLREHDTKNKTFPEKRENFAETSQLVMDRSNNRIVHEKARKIVEDAKKDIRQDVNMKRNVNDLDENNTERFQEQVNQIVLERTKKMEESLKSAIECEQDELKAYVKELFKKSFPDITPTGINESRNKHVDINLRDAAKESGRDISVGFMNESCGSARKMITEEKTVVGASFSGILAGGVMWFAGASAFAIAAPVVAVAAGTAACGYGLKKGLDWNKDRLDTNQRKQSAENTAKFVESKLEEVQKKSSDVMKRYSKESIQPYLDVLDNFQRGQEEQKRELKSAIDRVKQLLEKVRIIRMEMSKTEKNLADFNEKFLSNEKIILNDTFLLDAKFLSNEGIFARLFNYVVQFFSPRTTN